MQVIEAGLNSAAHGQPEGYVPAHES